MGTDIVKDINKCVDPNKKQKAVDTMALTSMDFLKCPTVNPINMPRNHPPFFFPIDDDLWNLPEADLVVDRDLIIRPSKAITPSCLVRLKEAHIAEHRKGWEYISVILESFVFGVDSFDRKPVDVVSNFSYADSIYMFHIPSQQRVLIPRIVAVAINHNCKKRKPGWEKLLDDLAKLNSSPQVPSYTYDAKGNRTTPFLQSSANPYKDLVTEERPHYRCVAA